jgi:mono/diheme cytochrome c family protein
MLMLGALLLAAAAGAAAFIALGAYDISATAQHTQPVYSLLEATMKRSVQRRAAEIAVPPLDAPAQIERGALCFRAHCVQCHGGPGVAPAAIGRSMQPLPGPLVDANARWSSAELYWITRHGIKMSGMPAWQHRLADADLWALVAFVRQLPALTAAGFERLTTATPGGRCDAPDAAATRPGDAERGRALLSQYACIACHRVPGVTGADVHVGPPLAGVGGRSLIAGALPNTPQQMVRWIRDPKSVDPLTTMPDLQVGEQDARDIAAYLATLQ